jgi:hypothetical protein
MQPTRLKPLNKFRDRLNRECANVCGNERQEKGDQ